MTTPASAEPTAEQRDAARVALLGKAANTVSPAVRKAMEAVWAEVVEDVARALAAAVTAEREKVRAQLAEIASDLEADDALYGRTSAPYYARRIREVTT